MSATDPEVVIEEFMEGEPRADLWRDLRKALQDRLHDAIATRDALSPEDAQRTAAEARVAELREQVAALAREEAITEFVEDSVRASLNRPARHPGGFLDDWDDAEV